MRACLLTLLTVISALSAVAGDRYRIIRRAIGVYINWSAYDEMSDDVELTEQLAMRQLDELIRLRRVGVRIDYYINDAFWYAKDSGYRRFRTPHWPNGPDAWISKCLNNGVKSGLWFGTNTLNHMDAVPEWEGSLTRERTSMCFFDGPFLRHLMDSMQLWYGRGVRIFKFDFAWFGAATPGAAAKYPADEIWRRNVDAFREALYAFREKNPEVVFIAYNGYGGDQSGAMTPFRKSVDLRWLDVFDALYSGDPRPADTPVMNFWRSLDIYSDAVVRLYERENMPLERIDSSAFMIGATGTCYRRGAVAWKSMLALSLARGGWVNTYYGNLDLLTDADAAWFAKAQRMYLRLQEFGRTWTFGGDPRGDEPYGFRSSSDSGSVLTVVNPSQRVAKLDLPVIENGRVLFRDAGYDPALSAGAITLGPEQMAVVGTGAYADQKWDLGIEKGVVIPKAIRSLPAKFRPANGGGLTAILNAPAGENVRVILRQLQSDGLALRTSGGAPPKGASMGQVLRITAEQDGRGIPVQMQYDRAIWSGLSWAVVEIKARDLTAGRPFILHCASGEKKEHRLEARAYTVRY
jgi:hypothetical protein